MKDYKVKITRNFTDGLENVHREIGKKTEVFMCTKERYEYLLSKGAVILIEKPEEKMEEVFEEVIEEIMEKQKKTRKKKIDKE